MTDPTRDQDAARASLGRMIDGLEGGGDPGPTRRVRRRDQRAAPPAPTTLERLTGTRTLALVMAGVVLLACLGGLLLV